MPNHYHLMIYTDERAFRNKQNLHEILDSSVLSRKIGTMQSSYCQAINIQENRTGSLFQQKAKAKQLNKEDQPLICFNYIHQNPLVAGLVENMEDWEFSSYGAYAGIRNDSLINKYITYQYIEISDNPERFIDLSMQVISQDKIAKLYR
jgi:hypothetical protein